jgi:hypothetical protein
VVRLFAEAELWLGDRDSRAMRSFKAETDPERSSGSGVEIFDVARTIEKSSWFLLGGWKAPVALYKLAGMMGARGAEHLGDKGQPLKEATQTDATDRLSHSQLQNKSAEPELPQLALAQIPRTLAQSEVLP